MFRLLNLILLSMACAISSHQLKCIDPDSPNLVCTLNYSASEHDIIINDKPIETPLNKVKDLKLVRTKLTNFPEELLRTFTDLEVLDITDTSLEDLSNKSLTYGSKLRKLMGSSNNLTTIRALTFSNNKNLVEIDLSFNQIQSIDDLGFYGLTKLEILNLNENLIGTINVYTFHNLTSLKVLHLNGNQIQVLGNLLFYTNQVLTNISLADNRISKINFRIFNDLQKFTIDLSGNECVNSKFYFWNGTENWDSEELKRCDENFNPRSGFSYEERENPNQKYEMTYFGLVFLAGLVGFALVSWRCRGC